MRPRGLLSKEGKMEEKKKNKSIVVKPKARHMNLTPFGFHRYSSEFLKAVRSFKGEKGFSPIP